MSLVVFTTWNTMGKWTHRFNPPFLRAASQDLRLFSWSLVQAKVRQSQQSGYLSCIWVQIHLEVQLQEATPLLYCIQSLLRKAAWQYSITSVPTGLLGFQSFLERRLLQFLFFLNNLSCFASACTSTETGFLFGCLWGLCIGGGKFLLWIGAFFLN